MANNIYIADLEKHWLAAETKADELKHASKRTQSEALLAQHAEAEREASEAFDRLWVARDVGSANAGMPTIGE